MYWLAPAPTRRHLAAVLIVVAALVWDLRPMPLVEHPVAAAHLPAGTEVGPGDVRWVGVPVGLLPPVDPEGFLSVDVGVGEPLLPSVIGRLPPLPPGWWEVTVDLPPGVGVGRPVRVALTAAGADTAALVAGVVVRAGDASGRGGAVAVADADAGRVAAAVAAGRVVVLVGS